MSGITNNGPVNYFWNLLADEVVAGEIGIATTGVAYTRSFSLPRNSSFSLDHKFTSPGTLNVKIELEGGANPPTTEGSADGDWGVIDVINSSVTAKDATAFDTVDPDVARYARLKITGQGSNDAGSKMTKARLHITKAR